MSSFKNAIDEVINKRAEKLFLASLLYTNALESNPQLLECEKRLRNLNLQKAKIKASNNAVPVELIKNIATEIKKRDSLLKELNITKKMLNPPPDCTLCNDSGRIHGKPCRCVVALAINKGDNLKIPLYDFSECNLSLYPKSVQKINDEIFKTVQKIIMLYPNNKRKNIIISGASGTGKTFLAGCCAKEMLTLGFSVTAVTAFELVNRALKYHTTFDDSKLSYLEPILESDLLIIDDLGFESVFKNITVEYLFMIINQRMIEEKLTFITTNLSREGLYCRYDESLLSRLFDKEKSYSTILTGNDKRTTKIDK